MSATLAGVSLSDIGRLAVGACFDEGAEAVINSISYHHDGEYLVTSSDDDAIRLYSVENATKTKTINVKQHGADCVRFTHHRNAVVCASSNGDSHAIRYLSLHDNAYLAVFEGHTDRVVDLEMSPIDDTLLSSSVDGSVRLWDLRLPDCQGVFEIGSRGAVGYDPSGVVAGVATGTNQVMLYDVRSFDKGPFDTFSVPQTSRTYAIVSIEFSVDGKLLLVSTDDTPVFVLDAFEGNAVSTLVDRANSGRLPIRSSFSADGAFVASGSEGGAVLVWSATSGELLNTLDEHPGTPVVCKWAPQSLLLASGCTHLGLWQPYT